MSGVIAGKVYSSAIIKTDSSKFSSSPSNTNSDSNVVLSVEVSALASVSLLVYAASGLLDEKISSNASVTHRNFFAMGLAIVFMVFAFLI